MAKVTKLKSTAPAHLAPLGKGKWNELVDKLELPDLSVLEAYCQCYARWRESEALLDAEGMITESSMGTKRIHPAAVHARDALGQMRLWADALGLTPKAQSQQGKKKAGDPAQRQKADVMQFIGRK